MTDTASIQTQLNQLQDQFNAFFTAAQTEIALDATDEKTENAAYYYELIKLQIASVFRNAEIFGKAISDYAQFLDPSLVNFGPTVSLVSPGSERILMDNQSVEAAKVVNLDSYQILISSLLNSGANPRQIFIGNRITQNGMVIDGNMIHTVVEGKVTASTPLTELLHITPESHTGTLHLENGSKITLVFSHGQDGEEQKLQEMHVTHADGSYVIFNHLQDENLETQWSEEKTPFVPFPEEMVPDGYSLFMSPEGAALFELHPTRDRFIARFGDERAMAERLDTASFGGNVYNFFFSPDDRSWNAAQLLPKNMEDPLPGTGFPPGLCPPDDCEEACVGVMPFDFSRSSIDDLIMEDLTGISPCLEKAKQEYLKRQLKCGNFDLETKLFILLYLFIQGSNEEITKIMTKMSDIDWSNNPGNPGMRPENPQQWNEDNIDQATIREQMDFWSNRPFESTTTDPGLRAQEFSAHNLENSAKMGAVNTDLTILQARLTDLIRNRQQFVDTITNSMKSIDDSLANTIRRIV